MSGWMQTNTVFICLLLKQVPTKIYLLLTDLIFTISILPFTYYCITSPLTPFADKIQAT